MIKILVIEDDPETRDVIATILRDENFECTEAWNGELGIEIAKKTIPDLIICDIQMPKMDGFEVLTRLASDPETDDIPFIFLTGNTSHDDIRKGMKIGADDYLVKPFKVEDLLDAVRTRIRKKETILKKYQMAIEETKKEFARAAHLDPITSLPNKLAFSEELHKSMNKNDSGLGMGVLLIGIDRMTNVNEAFGHFGGNFILQEVKVRILRCLTGDQLLFRGDYDFFIVLIPNLKQQTDAEDLIKKIRNELRSLFRYENQEIHITVSVGCGFYPSQCVDANVGIAQAEMAIHSVRYNGGNGFQFYDPDMKKFAYDQLTLESALARAAERKEFMVYFQAQLDMKTGAIKGMEALMRWKNPEFGMVSPNQFIPIAEANGMIIPMGEWILKAACAKAMEWHEMGHKKLKLAVNVSGRQLEPENLTLVVDKILKETGYPPYLLELEITESVLIKNPESTSRQIADLKRKGVMIAIDDFGSGYSSLSYLRQFAIDTLKLDHSFVKNLPVNPSDVEIASAVIRMAHSLKLGIVAEGIETKDQHECLKSLGCDEWQGFLHSPPVPAEEFLKQVEKNSKRV